MSISKGMDKEDHVHIYSGILFSHIKNKIGLFVETWMNLESVIIQREIVRKRKTNNTYMCINIWNLEK